MALVHTSLTPDGRHQPVTLHVQTNGPVSAVIQIHKLQCYFACHWFQSMS